MSALTHLLQELNLTVWLFFILAVVLHCVSVQLLSLREQIHCVSVQLLSLREQVHCETLQLLSLRAGTLRVSATAVSNRAIKLCLDTCCP